MRLILCIYPEGFCVSKMGDRVRNLNFLTLIQVVQRTHFKNLIPGWTNIRIYGTFLRNSGQIHVVPSSGSNVMLYFEHV